MLQIKTAEGVTLDLSTDTEFVLEMNQPLLSDSRAVDTFSTAISFPPTATNREVFGWYPVRYSIPTVLTVPATVYFDGVHIASGFLKFDSIEDGKLQYTFTSAYTDLDAEISFEKTAFMEDALGGGDVSLPLIVNANAVAEHIYTNSRLVEPVEPTVKYRNYYGYDADGNVAYPVSCPAVRLSAILKSVTGEFPSGMDSGIYSFLASLAVLFRTAPREIIATKTGLEGTRFDVSDDNAPAVTYGQLLAECLKMVCGAAYTVSGKTRLLSAADILGSSAAAVDYSAKVSDVYSAEVEPAQGYKFGFEDDADTFTSDTLADQDGNCEHEVQSYNDLFSGKHRWTNVALRVKDTGDVIARRYVPDSALAGSDYDDDKAKLIDADVTWQNDKTAGVNPGKDDVFDVSVAAHLPKVAPTVVRRRGFPSTLSRLIAPIVPAEAADAERSGELYIGIVSTPEDYPCQFGRGDWYYTADLTLYHDTSVTPLRTAALYEKFHREFAQWIGSDRVRAKCSMAMTAFDLASVRLDKPVHFAGRRWLVSKITATFRASRSTFEAEGEFITI